MEPSDLLKNSLNLPQTEFPMRASLAEREPKRVAFWEQNRLYQRIQERNINGPKFVLHDGPPFTNGDIHIGTALNKILKDCTLRYKSMRGFQTPFHPGWDCHGLPIEHKVMQELKAQKATLDAAGIRKACAAFSAGYIAKQSAQFKRLGVLANWDRQYRTMDPHYEANILRVFAAFVSQDLIYRSKKPVYWSIPCETALAEGEIEYQEHVSPSVWVRFALTQDAIAHLGLPATSIVIWTTTPWTLPANLAIAVHPDFEYAALQTASGVYLVAAKLAEAFAKACSLGDYTILKSFKGRELEKLNTQHPFIERLSPIVLADYVTLESGTGCVHTAPGHGLDDYLTGLKYGLPIYSPINDQGCYEADAALPAELIGKPILADKGKPSANGSVLEILKARQALIHSEPYTHSYPHCWRSKTPVIFRATDQWFVALDAHGFRERTLAAIQSVKWVPEWGIRRITGSVQARPDWCISRQRTWGVPIPIFYDAQGQPLLDATVIQGIADKIAQFGSDYWFEQPAEVLLSGITLPPAFQNQPLTKGLDTLDVWIDSGSSHLAVLQSHPELACPADLYLEGSDQHRGWFQSSLWTSIAVSGKPPYKQIITHGFVVDEDKKKVSKSAQGQGKSHTALDYVNQYGADIVRLWICSEDYRNDIPISSDILSHVVQTYRTLRNTLRFQLGNLYDFDYSQHAVPANQWTYLEKWVMHEAALMLGEVTKAYDAYEFHKAYQLINRFCSVTLSATYHDILKDRLYTYGRNWTERRAAQTVIHELFTLLTKVLAPILTFTADEAWSFLHTKTDSSNQSIHLEAWPKPLSLEAFAKDHAAVETLFAVKGIVNEALEKQRQNKVLGQSLDACVQLYVPVNDDRFSLLQSYLEQLPELFIVSTVTLHPADTFRVEVVPATGFRCPRSWRWVPELVPCPGHSDIRISPRCQRALAEAGPLA